MLQLTYAIREDQLKSYFIIERRLFALLSLLLILDEAKIYAHGTCVVYEPRSVNKVCVIKTILFFYPDDVRLPPKPFALSKPTGCWIFLKVRELNYSFIHE